MINVRGVFCFFVMVIVASIGLLISSYTLLIEKEPFVDVVIRFLQFNAIGLIAISPIILLAIIGLFKSKTKGE